MAHAKQLLTVALFTLAACGAGDGTTTLSAAQGVSELQGAVLEVDGQTVTRDGIEILIPETGDRIVTDGNGGFAFPDLSPGWYTLDFNAPRALAALETDGEGEGSEESDGEESDGEESDGEESDGEEEQKDEDHLGRPRFEIDREGPHVIIKVVLDNGTVISWSKSHANHRFMRVNLERADGSPDENVEGKIQMRSWYGGERQQLAFKARHLSGGDVVAVFLRDGSIDINEFKKIGIAEANRDGVAVLKFDTKYNYLPLEAESLSDLAGYQVEVRMAEGGDALLKGEIPALPERAEKHEEEEEPREEEEREEEEERPEFAPPVHGSDRLMAKVDFVWGNVQLWNWADKDLERFRMVAGGLNEGDVVHFQIRKPGTEIWETFATRTAQYRDEEGERYVAKVDTEWFGVLPLHADEAIDLIGLGVRVVRDEQVILIGEVPELVDD